VSDNENSRSRRRLLKALAGAGGVYTAGKVLPETWSRPVVDALTLPAHAQMSGTYYGQVEEVLLGRAEPGGSSLLDILVPAAQAQTDDIEAELVIDREPPEIHICSTPAGDSGEVDVVITNFGPGGGGVRCSGLVPIDGGPTLLSDVEFGEDCKVVKKGFDCRCQLDRINAGKLFLFGEEFPIDFFIPQRPCDLPPVRACEFDDDVIPDGFPDDDFPIQ